MPLAPGTRLDPYDILGAIGAGAMGACGHAARREACGIRVSSRWGSGPTAL